MCEMLKVEAFIFYDGCTSKNCLTFTLSRGTCIVLKVPQGVCTLVLLKSSPSYLLTSLPQRISFKERSCTSRFFFFFPLSNSSQLKLTIDNCTPGSACGAYVAAVVL